MWKSEYGTLIAAGKNGGCLAKGEWEDLHSPDIEVCRCMSASHCIFIWLPGPFADTFLKINVSFICLFLSLQIHFALPTKYKYILNRFILRLEDTFQRQIVSSIYIFLHLKILSADQWYLQTLEIIIADTFSGNLLKFSSSTPSESTSQILFSNNFQELLEFFTPRCQFCRLFIGHIFTRPVLRQNRSCQLLTV